MKKLNALAIAAGLLTAGAAFAQQPQAPLPAHSSGSTNLQSPGAAQGMPAAGQFNPGGTSNGTARDATTTSAPAPSTTSTMPATNADMTRSSASTADSSYTAPADTRPNRARRSHRAPRHDRG